MRWYRKAAEQGLAQAQCNLGRMYDNGEGVPKDATEAVSWFRKAAEKGNPQAQFELGVAYANGEGVVKDEAEAIRWYLKAAEQGDADAEHNLGVAYANGEGVVKDEAEAARWYREASEQVITDAQTRVSLKQARTAAENDARGRRVAAQQSAIDAPRQRFAQSITDMYQQRLRRNGADPNRTYFEAELGNFPPPSLVTLVIGTNAIDIPSGAQEFLQNSTWIARAYAIGYRGIQLMNRPTAQITWPFNSGDTLCTFIISSPTTLHPRNCRSGMYGEVSREWPRDMNSLSNNLPRLSPIGIAPEPLASFRCPSLAQEYLAAAHPA